MPQRTTPQAFPALEPKGEDSHSLSAFYDKLAFVYNTSVLRDRNLIFDLLVDIAIRFDLVEEIVARVGDAAKYPDSPRNRINLPHAAYVREVAEGIEAKYYGCEGCRAEVDYSVLCKVLRHTGKPPGWYIYARGPDPRDPDGFYSERHGDFDNVADAIAAAKKLARERGWLFVGLEPTIRDTLEMWGG